MSKNGPDKIARRFPGERACDDCNEYEAHLRHHGLVYRCLVYPWFVDEQSYHHHIAHCPDSVRPTQPERVQ